MVLSPKFVLSKNTDMKVLKSSSISSFGGLNFVLEELDKLGISQILQHDLPKLSAQSKYNWKDLLYSFWSIFFCGGDCTEDLSIHLKEAFNYNTILATDFLCIISSDLKSLPIYYFTTPQKS